jgi:hypothetical protein
LAEKPSGPTYRCPSCGHENRGGSRYCAECGAFHGSPAACPSCGAENRPGQRFCNWCGTALDASEEPSVGRPGGEEPSEGIPPEDLEAPEGVRGDLPDLEPEFLDALRKAAGEPAEPAAEPTEPIGRPTHDDDRWPPREQPQALSGARLGQFFGGLRRLVSAATEQAREFLRESEAPTASVEAVPRQAPWWQRYGPELLLAGMLAVVAFLVRRHGLPTDGLWRDDSEGGSALAASSPSQLFAVGVTNPGFIAGLIGWSHISGDASLVYPGFIAGTLGPPLLFLFLRACGYERSISVLLGAALTAAGTAIVYSGRLKTYPIDVVIVLALAAVLPRLVRTRWRWQTGVAWAAVAIVVSFFSGFALIAAAAAVVVLVLRPNSDLRVRVLAAAAQAVVCAVLLMAESRTYNSSELETHWRDIWDGFVTFHINPISFSGEVLVHLRRLAETFVGGPGWFATLCVVVALIGLGITAWKGRQAIRARYLLIVFGVALVGSVLGKLPFGPIQASPQSDGGRVSLWLIPVLAMGLAAILQGLRGVLPNRRAVRIGFDAAAYVATAAILVSAVAAKQLPYPFPGAKSASDFIDSRLGAHDAVLIGYHAHWSFATESNTPYKVKPVPKSEVGFQPDFTDPRVHYLDVGRHAEQSLGQELVDPQHIGPDVKHADRVFVYYAMPLVEQPETGARAELDHTLRTLGFERQPTVHFGAARVEVWRRGTEAGHNANRRPAARRPAARRPAAATGQINLRLSDLPPGWGSTPPPASSLTTGILACLHVSTVKTTQKVVTATNPKSQLNAASEVTVWPSPTAAQSSYAVLSGPDAAGCIKSTLESALRGIGLSAAVTGKKVPPPPTGGDSAVAYTGTIRISNGTRQLAQGSIVFFTHKKVGVLISGYGVQPFPANLLSSLVATVADRTHAATP